MSESDWKEFQLGSILRYLDERVVLDDETEYLTITIKRRHGGLEIREKLLGQEIATKKQFRLVPGALIISRVQCWHQAYAIVGNVPANAIASTNYDQFAISPEVAPRFFWWLSHSPQFTETIRSSAVGVVVEKMVFNRGKWLTKIVRLPPLAEQRRIVARIDELAAKIEEAKTLRKQAAEEAEALVPAAKTDLYNEALRLAGRMERLEDLCTRITDGTHITPRYVEVGIPFISVKDITGGRICLESSRRISAEEHARLFRHCNPVRDDVLLTKVGTIGYAKVVDVDEEFSIFVSLALLKLRKDRVLPHYIEHILNSAIIRDRAIADTRGVGNQNLVLKFIKEFPIPAPTLPEQRRIVAELDALQAEAHALQRLQAETAAELDALLPSILDKAFKGEL